jgi:integrase
MAAHKRSHANGRTTSGRTLAIVRRFDRNSRLIGARLARRKRSLGIIPIQPELQEVLTRRRKGPDGNDLPADAYVFGDDTGRVLSRERLCERWRRVCATAGVQGLHLHDLRGEFASRMAESGVPTHLVRDSLGHAS